MPPILSRLFPVLQAPVRGADQELGNFSGKESVLQHPGNQLDLSFPFSRIEGILESDIEQEIAEVRHDRPGLAQRLPHSYLPTHLAQPPA